jgi:hypothetical protein
MREEELIDARDRLLLFAQRQFESNPDVVDLLPGHWPQVTQMPTPI